MEKISHHTFDDFLVKRSGLTDEEIAKGKPDLNFERILKGLCDIHRGKEALYGNYLETHGKDPDAFFLTQHFCDLKRKYVRAENFIKQFDPKDKDGIQLEQLIDTYSDMAVYAVMGIQAVFHIINRRVDEMRAAKEVNKELRGGISHNND